MKFDYQLKRDIEKPSRGTINMLRILGLFFIITGIVALFGNNLEKSTIKIILYSLHILFGMIQLIFPELASKRIILNNETISIDDSRVSWKLSKNQSVNNLEISAIKNIEIFSGEVHFQTMNEKKHILTSHKIRNILKFEEFNRIIRELQREVRK